MRTIPTATRNAFESQHNAELLLLAGEITSPYLYEPIRVITEDVNGISYNEDKIINYNWDGGYGGPLYVYQGFPFVCYPVTDDDNPPPRTKISLFNVDRRIGDAILAIQESPYFRLTGLVSSDFNDLFDANNARTPLGTPGVWYDVKYLRLRNIEGDQQLITADIIGLDVSKEPCPFIRTTKERAPGTYR